MKAFKFRLYPTVAQARELNTQINEACRLYNAALEERAAAWKKGIRVGFYQQCAQLKDIRAAGDLGISSYRVASEVLWRVDRSFQSFFRRIKAGGSPGYPRFRSARRYDSITFEVGHGARLFAGDVRLHGVGSVRFLAHREVEGEPKTAIIKREAGRWYVIVVADTPAELLPETRRAVGVDVGLASFAVYSTGEAVEAPRLLRAGERRLRIAQRRVARRVKGSKGRRKAIQLLQRAHAHVRDQRRDFHHKVSRDLVNHFDLIAVEDLQVRNMVRARPFAKSISDAGWSSFRRILTDKAANAGRVVVAVNPSGTSQACSGCGALVSKRLSERTHACPHCGLTLDRDHNAARNILEAGLALAESTWPDVRACVSAETEE